MVWNYRVIKLETSEGFYFEVCEVYYDESNKPIAYAQRNPLVQEDLSSLRWVHAEIEKAIAKPVLILVDGLMVEEATD